MSDSERPSSLDHFSDSEPPSSSNVEESDEEAYPSTTEDLSSFGRRYIAAEVLKAQLKAEQKNEQICPSCRRKIEAAAGVEAMVVEILRSRLNSEPTSPSNSYDNEDGESSNKEEKKGLSAAEVLSGQLNAEQKNEAITSPSTSMKNETTTEIETMGEQFRDPN
ncbi:unnamed protein product [Sphenostylis stenocarpa]|uniref:Uncharacterized protein n=1 Tax=Sphenostylis stenocarpa TaxID=92480 RepID=A0AA86VQ32_9FABA|nr:unnamed protein product [Sphenostylis stenocarpa]